MRHDGLTNKTIRVSLKANYHTAENMKIARATEICMKIKNSTAADHDMLSRSSERAGLR